VALIADDTEEPAWRSAIQESSAQLRDEIGRWISGEGQSTASRLASIEEALSREHKELLAALQSHEELQEDTRQRDSEVERVAEELCQLQRWAEKE
ncbi:unnamed protein product, partial [Polarella glacialis]